MQRLQLETPPALRLQLSEDKTEIQCDGDDGAPKIWLVRHLSIFVVVVVEARQRHRWHRRLRGEYNTVDVVPQRWWLRGILIDDDISKKMLYWLPTLDSTCAAFRLALSKKFISCTKST